MKIYSGFLKFSILIFPFFSHIDIKKTWFESLLNEYSMTFLRSRKFNIYMRKNGKSKYRKFQKIRNNLLLIYEESIRPDLLFFRHDLCPKHEINSLNLLIQVALHLYVTPFIFHGSSDLRGCTNLFTILYNICFRNFVMFLSFLPRFQCFLFTFLK